MMLSTRYMNDDYIEIGIDEAGRGSFWGPITAGAMIIPDISTWTDKQRILFEQLKDSKKISPKKRDRIADEIMELVPKTSIGMVTAAEINENGITWANIEAFRRAIHGLLLTEDELSKSRAIIDGLIQIDNWMYSQNTIIDGDAKYLAIAGASILAKVAHDKWISNYCDNNPECNEKYDLIKSKGYGTANHRLGIKTYGVHELHRSLFVQNWLPGTIPKTKSNAKNKLSNSSKCLIKFN